MWLYDRYVDASNQVAEIPQLGSHYDVLTKKVITDDRNIIEGDEGDARVAKVLTAIANSVREEIVIVLFISHVCKSLDNPMCHQRYLNVIRKYHG